MVTFLTFFLGLTVGIHAVELSVTGAVARVEIRLEGDTVAEIDGPPWKTTVDFGSRLQPAVLEALAFSEEGRLVGHDSQRVNLPRQRAEATLVPEIDQNGKVASIQLLWSSAEFVKPRRIRFTLDDQRIQADGQLRAHLGEHVEDTVHVLEAELVFPDDVIIREQIVFGKGHIGDISLDLTAVPVLIEDPDALPAAAEMQGWFEVDGKTVDVVDVEKGSAQLVVVRGPSVNENLKILVDEIGNDRNSNRDDRFTDDVVLRVIGPVASAGPHGNARLFPFSDPQPVGRKGLADTLEKARFSSLEFGYRRPADAVALAGLRAAGGNQRRAVLLLLGGQQEDASSHSPADVRRYLSQLRVPLVVFNFDRTDGAAEDWRPTETISDSQRWLSSVRWLREDLEYQRVIWIAGDHLLRDVRLTNKARGLELVQ